MSFSASLSVASVRYTAALMSIVVCSAVRMSATRSVPVESRSLSTISTTVCCGSSGSAVKSAVALA